MNELDCRGLNCPAPVLAVRNLLEQGGVSDVSVTVDNDAARQNVTRFLEHQGFQVTSDALGSDFRVVGSRGEGEAGSRNEAAPAAAEARVGSRKVMVLITSSHMGHGDDGLGDMLMFNFLKTLKEMGPELWRVVFVNSGVSFVVEGSEAVPVLQELGSSGVHVSACGACLAYFHILDKVQVGEVTNMLEIVTGMKLADSVVTI